MSDEKLYTMPSTGKNAFRWAKVGARLKSMPEYKTTGSSGMDLCAVLDSAVEIQPGAVLLVPTGIAIQLPSGFEGQVRPRSGMAIKNKITVVNAPGTIDADYRGQIQVGLINLGDKAFLLSPGDRIAQLVICPVVQAQFELVDLSELTATDRGAGGFGSTGTK